MNIATVPPPVIYALCAGLGLLADTLLPRLDSPYWLRVAAIVGIAASLGVMPFVLRRFRALSTPFDVRKTPTGLVVNGPFQFSRNPSYVALTVLYVGVALLVGSVGMLVLSPVPIVVLNGWVIPLEEARLEQVFGEAYLDYKRRVRRWL